MISHSCSLHFLINVLLPLLFFFYLLIYFIHYLIAPPRIKLHPISVPHNLFLHPINTYNAGLALVSMALFLESQTSQFPPTTFQVIFNFQISTSYQSLQHCTGAGWCCMSECAFTGGLQETVCACVCVGVASSCMTASPPLPSPPFSPHPQCESWLLPHTPTKLISHTFTHIHTTLTVFPLGFMTQPDCHTQ